MCDRTHECTGMTRAFRPSPKLPRRMRDLVLWYLFVFVVLPALFYFANVLGALFSRLWGW